MIVRQYAPCSLGRSIICLGKQGEINALRVEFDVSAWMAMYPDATVKLMHFAPDRPQDNPVIPTLGVEGTLRVWIVGEEDTAGAGNGVIELLLIDERTGSTIKSATGYTTVLRSPSAGIEAQEAEAGYVRYDVDQSALLTDEQKAMARKNIGAGTGDGTGSGGILKETDPTVPDWAKQPRKPTYTASEVGARPDTWTPSASDVGADAAGTASGAVATHNVSGAAHADLRALIEGLTSRLNALADSDDTTLDQLSEIVAYIKSNKSLIDAVTTGKVSVSDIVDNLTTNASGKVLSAAQGVALKAMIDGIVIPTALPNPHPITINGQRYDGSEAVTVTVSSEGGGTPVEIDDTLTQSGKAADAKVVGDRLSALKAAIDAKGDPTDEQIQTAVDSYLSGIAISGISAEEKQVFLTLFKAAAYTIDVSGTIAELETLWGGTVEPDDPVVPTTYTITNTLTNATNDNTTSVITEGVSYTATITADEGYTLTGAAVSVTMGGTDITADAYVDGVITIASVTGNVVITVTAVEEATEDLGWTSGVPYTLEWTDGYKLDNSTGAEVADTSGSVSNFIPCSNVHALTGNNSINGGYLYAYDADMTYKGRIVFNASYPSPVNREVAYVRVVCLTANKDTVELVPNVYAELTENTAWVADTYYSCGSYVSPGSVSETTGALGQSGNWWRSEYLNCYGATNVSIVGNLKYTSWRKKVVFYDADKNYISGTIGTDSYGAVPENAKYFVVSGYDGFEYTIQKANRPWIKLT